MTRDGHEVGGGQVGRPPLFSHGGGESSGWAPFERALDAAYIGECGPLIVRSDAGEEEQVDPTLFLREESEFEPWERLALELAEGRVLDVAAGAGPHSLALQARGVRVTAIDALSGAVRIMRSRGVLDASVADCFSLPVGRWDTLLYLMNGTMPFGTLPGLQEGLIHARTRVTPAGRLLIDSTDVRDADGGDEQEDGRYLGEVQYQFEYGGEQGAPIPQLFVDPIRLSAIAGRAGWQTEVVWSDEDGHYLADLAARD